MPIKISGYKYTTFEDIWNETSLTPEEKDHIKIKVELIGKLIEEREKRGLTQKALAELCGVKQPFIARMERGDTDPQMTTILKVLKPLGYTVAIVPIDDSP